MEVVLAFLLIRGCAVSRFRIGFGIAGKKGTYYSSSNSRSVCAASFKTRPGLRQMENEGWVGRRVTLQTRSSPTASASTS